MTKARQPPPVRVCEKCGTTLVFPQDYTRDKAWVCGYNLACKYCRAKQSKAYRNRPENKARLRALSAAKRADPIIRKRRNESSLAWMKKRGRTYRMWRCAKERAESRGLEFAIEEADIFIPDRCPLLGIPIQKEGKLAPGSPSLDRIDPAKGYVRGNVWVISHRANAIKNDATVEELERIVTALRRCWAEAVLPNTETDE